MGEIEEAIAIDKTAAEPQLALAVALYIQGDRDKAVETAKQALKIDKNFANLDYLKHNLWGDQILSDTQKMFVDFNIEAID